jgi:hypothetical protein
MYKHILTKIRAARPTGTTSRVELLGQRICLGPVCPRVYHVGIRVHERDVHRIFEHGPIAYDPTREIDPATNIIIPLPSVERSIEDIMSFESTLPSTYLVGIRDCRHHVLDLLDYLYVHGTET